MDHKLPLGSNIPTTDNSETVLVFLLWEFQDGRIHYYFYYYIIPK